MIDLYDKDGITKIGQLDNCIACLVEEERNGLFELYLTYPTGHELYDKLEKDNIIIANANDTLKSQKFRIYLTRKSMSNRVEVYARHISFDLAYDIVESLDITNQSCEYCLNQIFRQSNFSKHFRGYSDVISAQNFNASLVNCMEAIAGTKGSILDTFGTGAEILRDNTNIYVKNSRGHDNEVVIAYRKNLTGLEVEEDTTDLITRIYPYAKYTDENNKEIFIKYENKFVDSKYLDKYPHPYIRSIDFSDKFKDDEVPTSSKLKLCADTYFNQNKCDIPKCNYKIEFIPLSKCVGYEELEDKISLCDKITIQDERYGIDTQAKVIKAVYNVLVERYESMELGNPKTTLGDIIDGEDGDDGKPGPPGPPGPPGEDGSIGDFPDTLPDVPILEGEVLGFASVELKWTYESEVYYEYELYASKKINFVPGDVDLIFKGQASAFLYQVLPDETWYYRVRAVNSHQNKTEFSNQLEIKTFKISDAANYFEEAAIGNALIGNLSADKIKSGKISGHYIDARNLSVTDSNGKRTLDVDSYGNVNLEVASFRLAGNTINGIASSEANKVVNAQTQLDIFNKLTNGGQTQGIYLNSGKLYLNASYIQTGTIACDMINSTNVGHPIIKLFENCAIDATKLNEQGKGDAIRLKWDSLNYIRISSASTEMYSSQAGGTPTFRFTGSKDSCSIYSAPNRSLSFESDGLYTNNVKISVEGHKHDGVYKPNNYVPSWNEITSKPSSYAPSSHKHSGDALTPDNVSPRAIGNGNSILMHSALDGNNKNLGWSSSKFGQVVANNGYFGNMYSSAIDNPVSTLEDNSLNDVIDDIIIESPNVVLKSDLSSKLLVNVNKLKENVNADLFVSYDDAGSVVVNESNLLALALKEIKSLKNEIEILKAK